MSSAAEFQIGQSYFEAKDYARSFKIFETLARSGHVQSQVLLGYLHFNGIGTAVNHRLARKFYIEASQGGDAGAQHNLANMLLNGHGGPEDFEEAHRLLRLAAGSGLEVAQAHFALNYLSGTGVSRDIRRGAELLLQYGDEGNAEAQYTLGNLYAEGSLVKQNWEKAATWWLNAAERGHALAQLEIGRSFAVSGRGLKVDYINAYKFLTLSYMAATPGVDEAFELLRDKFTDAMMAQARKHLDEWKPMTGKGLAFALSSQMLA